MRGITLPGVLWLSMKLSRANYSRIDKQMRYLLCSIQFRNKAYCQKRLQYTPWYVVEMLGERLTVSGAYRGPLSVKEDVDSINV